jgi:hypothetical protein
MEIGRNSRPSAFVVHPSAFTGTASEPTTIEELSRQREWGAPGGQSSVVVEPGIRVEILAVVDRGYSEELPTRPDPATTSLLPIGSKANQHEHCSHGTPRRVSYDHSNDFPLKKSKNFKAFELFHYDDYPNPFPDDSPSQIGDSMTLPTKDIQEFFEAWKDGEGSFKDRRRRGPYRICPPETKEKIVDICDRLGLKKAAQVFKVPVKNIKRWIHNGPERKKGAGRKTTDPTMETAILKWITDYFDGRGQFPTFREIKLRAKHLSNHQAFLASKGWCDKFIKRNILFFKGLKEKKSAPSHAMPERLRLFPHGKLCPIEASLLRKEATKYKMDSIELDTDSGLLSRTPTPRPLRD